MVKNKLNEWHDQLVEYFQKLIKGEVNEASLKVKSSILSLYDGAEKKLKDAVEKETVTEHKEQTEGEVDLISQEQERAQCKARDHCHYTSLFQGAAHSNCNLKYRIPNHILIVFRNLSGYDAHLFIKELGKKSNKGN